MSVFDTLQACLSADGKSIDITPAKIPSFGSSIAGAIAQIFAGSIQVDGASFKLAPTDTGDGATVTGTGSAAPLVQQFQVIFTFVDSGGNVSMTLTGSLTSAIPITSAWSGASAPFTDITISGGSVSMQVNPSDSSFDLAISATAAYQSQNLGTGLLEVQYGDSKLGFLAGFIVTSGNNSWSPNTDLPVIGTLSLSGEAGAFFSTITVSDLSAFDSLKLPYLPSEIDPGVTFLGSITLDGTLAPINSILPKGTELDLLANIPPAGVTQATITAEVKAPPPTNSFQFTDLALTWKSTSADSGTITLSITAMFVDQSNTVNLTGDATFVYGTTPTLEGEMTASGNGDWTHPFGIENLTIKSFSLAFSLAEDGIALGLEGDITIGAAGGAGAVDLELAGAILDFDIPIFILAKLSSDTGQSVTLVQLIDDFIPNLLPANFPLLSQISFKELEFYAVAQEFKIDEKQYYPGIGATGDISFFGYDLDFSFSLVTSPTQAVKAMGTISYNGGPIVVSIGGLTILTISDSTGTKGPTACIDTAGSGFCGGTAVPNAYFYINAAVNLLGLASVSVVAAASKSLFEFELALDAGGVFTENLQVQFDPSGASPNFAASVATGFNPPDITLGSWGIIPQFTIPTPKINVCCALGTVMPPAAPCSDGWMPTSTPYFHFDLMFTWGPISFSLDVSLDFNDVQNAFQNFGSWIVTYCLDNAGEILGEILADAAKLAQLLLYIGQEILALAEWVYDKVVAAIQTVFSYAYDVASQIVQDALSVLQQCAQDVGNSDLGSPIGPSSQAMAAPVSTASGARIRVPAFEVDLRESQKGQQLLHHYYLHRSEFHRIVNSDTAAGAACRASLEAQADPIQAILNIVSASMAAGSSAYQTSATEVLTLIEPHRTSDYSGFVGALSQ